MIKEAYCSYEVAKLLKEKGFSEDTWYYYDISRTNPELYRWLIEPHANTEAVGVAFISAPTHQMALAWLREKSIFIDLFIDDDSEMPWTYNVYKKLQDGTTECIRHHHGNYYALDNGYEEAVEAALLFTLEHFV